MDYQTHEPQKIENTLISLFQAIITLPQGLLAKRLKLDLEINIEQG